MSRRNQRKKIVLVYVEGPSDETALIRVFESLMDTREVHIEITFGDLTSDKMVNAQNIVKTLGDSVRSYLDGYSLKPDDIRKVVYILDTDGTYCNQSCIQENPALKEFQYTETSICAHSIQAVLDRNERKAKNMDRLAGMEFLKIKKTRIPFEAYYMSCNLDHVIQDRLNLTDDEKEAGAYEFAAHCEDNKEYCESFFSNPAIAVMGSQTETWNFIRDEDHSLERHTNLMNCFRDGV